jgi:polyisoprenoid-binding protein YceI
VAAIRIIFFTVLSISAVLGQTTGRVYMIDDGKIDFKSEAPLEIIKASSTGLKGLIDFDKQTFAFSIPIGSFNGFNSTLQQEHFNENYMESDKFPRATFTGRLIEKIDVDQNGVYTVRAKGKLNIHGIEQERIIQTAVTIQDSTIEINSSFSIPLQDHNIAIPKVVQQKIAETISVALIAKGKRK